VSHKYYLCKLKKSRVTILTKKRIKKYTHLVLLLVVALSLHSYNVSAQYFYDLGFGGGVSGYTGDVSNNPFASPGHTYSALLRSNISSRFAMRLEIDYGTVGGHTDDVVGTYPGAQGICDFEFETQFVSTDLVFEVNFFPYPFQKTVMNSSNITPFAFAGVGYVNYTILEGPIVPGEDGKNYTASLPFGIGLRYLFNGKWGLQLEFKSSKLFRDDFDTYALSDPFEFNTTGDSNETSSEIHNEDWLYTTTVMLTYSFGENIWDCNCPGGYKRKKKR
jgi:hypothetical protein